MWREFTTRSSYEIALARERDWHVAGIPYSGNSRAGDRQIGGIAAENGRPSNGWEIGASDYVTEIDPAY